MKIYTNELGHMTSMASMPIYGKNLKKSSSPEPLDRWLVGWLVGCFGFNGPLRQYFSLYWAVSQREGEKEERK